MASNPRANHQALSKKSGELATAASQVVAHRVTRMVLAGPMPSERDQVEFKRMVEEKKQAFTESWLAMTTQTLLAHQAIATTAWRSLCFPWLGGGATPAALASQMQNASFRVIHKAMAPVHRTAMANARRLSKTPLLHKAA